MAIIPRYRTNSRLRSKMRLRSDPISRNRFSSDPQYFSMFNGDEVQRILDWQNTQSNRLHSGGLLLANWASNSSITGSTTNAGGRTFVSDPVETRVLQDGYVRQVKLSVNSVGDSTVVEQHIKFKVFRPAGIGTFRFVGESEMLAFPGVGTQVYNLANPIPCQEGDAVGFWITYGGVGHQAGVNVKTGGGLYYDNNDLSELHSYGSFLAFTIDMEVLTSSPFLVVTGDSIPEGHNGATSWHSSYDGGPSGLRSSEISNQLKQILGSGFALEQQNHAMGGQTFAWVASTGIVSAHAVLPNSILVHCGVNDISAARSWANVETDLNTIKSVITTERLLVDEILPWSAGTNAQADTVRLWNKNLAVWCASNGAVLVKCHDEMGQIRAATGLIDDLYFLYNKGDGVHLSQIGVDKLASIWRKYI